MNGIINVLKPPGMTSHDVVYWLRKITGQKKAGHTGTLDPGAAGVLPVCLGKATKVIEFLPDRKQYLAEVVFGRSTATHDSFGRTSGEFDARGLTAEAIERQLANFRGRIEQIPPMVSALKHQGKKLYELARAGIEVERKPRPVQIDELTLLSFTNHNPRAPKAVLKVSCSAGTYIRTLCHDLGSQMGCGAYMSFLLRTMAGAFALADTATMEKIAAAMARDNLAAVTVSLSKALDHLPSVPVRDQVATAVCHGNRVFLPAEIMEQTGGQVVRLEGPSGLLALAAVEDWPERPGFLLFQPLKVLV
ncbi:MAG: tRNA pseudouridine(55) synthase TruB [Firmicutes bacterium]|nr:tRNA pseudouridine(55) synthase TruB [Bacillota bacterium]